METPYKISDLQNPSIRELVAQVTGLFPARLDSHLLLEEVGYGLNQLDWTDETWNYVVVRGTPVWVSNNVERRHDLVHHFVASLRSKMGIVGPIEVEAMSSEPEARVTIRWGKSRHSIGD